MKIKTSTGTYLDLYPISVKTQIELGYNLVETTSRILRSVDRGVRSDSYGCEMSFKGTEEYITSIYRTIQNLRTNNLKVEFTECDENYFGENVDHSGIIPCVVIKMDATESPAFNVWTLKINFLADTGALTFTGVPQLPTNLCTLNMGWKGYSVWNTNVNVAYFGDINFVNREEDTYIFEGSWKLNNEDLRNLLSFNKQQRGNTFNFPSPVNQLFGPDLSANGTNPLVVIEELNYERISPVLFNVNLKLIKQ